MPTKLPLNYQQLKQTQSDYFYFKVDFYQSFIIKILIAFDIYQLLMIFLYL